MKKIVILLLIGLMISTYMNCSAQIGTTINNKSDEWTGMIRIEGKEQTVWMNKVTVSETSFYAKNIETGEFEQFNISFPSVIGALDEAANLGNFSYVVEYWPSWDAFLLTSINGEDNWWHYWVNHTSPDIGMNAFKLAEDHKDILIGYLEQYDAKALSVSIDKDEVKKDEEFTLHVCDFNGESVVGATIHVGDENFTSGIDGNLTASISEKGSYELYAEKEDFIRSEKINIHVRKTKHLALDIIKIVYAEFVPYEMFSRLFSHNTFHFF